jgi:hypothetical protein
LPFLIILYMIVYQSQDETSKKKKNAELSLLVKSVKSKTKSLLEKSAKNKANKRS